MEQLTHRQQEILNYIKEYASLNGCSPSYREIRDHFRFASLAPVAKHLIALKRKKHLDPHSNGQRALLPLAEHSVGKSSEILLPFIGYLSGGAAIETFPKIQQFAFPASQVSSPENTYVLQARGDGLNEELIAADDFLVIEARGEVAAGETIIGLINGQDTVIKRYFLEEDGYVRLTGHHAHITPIIIPKNNITIQGVLVAVLRFMR